MSDDELNDGRVAAEDYRAQRQIVDARASGFEAMTPERFFSWTEENRSKLEKIARENGAEEAEVEAIVTEYLDTLKALPIGARFDDLNVTLILTDVIRRIEAICSDGKIPIRDGVAYGVAPRLGLEASQLAVMGTRASIITVSQGFPIFCNMVSKAVALSLVKKGDQVSWDPVEVRQRLEEHPEIGIFWVQILTAYAIDGWPPDTAAPPLDMVQQFTRLLTLRAMELFAVAHEYGHHIFEHGGSESSDAMRDDFKDEHEADIFGRLICLKEGLSVEPPNLYAASGVGAVLMLGALELVRRVRALLETGVPVAEPRKSHPPLKDRLLAIAGADEFAHEADRPIFEDLRSCAERIIDMVWEFAEPAIRGLHKAGARPQPTSSDVGGWLPGR